MTEHGAATDAGPELYAKVMAADLLVLMTPTWLGEKSSVCTRVMSRVERLCQSTATLVHAGLERG
jgi:multimeric flavodoxin WrbA